MIRYTQDGIPMDDERIDTKYESLRGRIETLVAQMERHQGDIQFWINLANAEADARKYLENRVYDGYGLLKELTKHYRDTLGDNEWNSNAQRGGAAQPNLHPQFTGGQQNFSQPQQQGQFSSVLQSSQYRHPPQHPNQQPQQQPQQQPNHHNPHNIEKPPPEVVHTQPQNQQQQGQQNGIPYQQQSLYQGGGRQQQ